MAQRSAAVDTLFHSRSLENFLTFLVMALLSPVAGAFVLTQYLAHGLHYHRALGLPCLVLGRAPFLNWIVLVLSLASAVALAVARGWRPFAPLCLVPGVVFGHLLWLGPVYPPFRGLSWIRPLLRAPRLWALTGTSVLLGLGTAGVVFALGYAVYRKLGPREEVAEVAFGSSRPATTADLRRAGLLRRGGGTVLGGWETAWRRRPLRDASEHHVLLLMPSGAGKTTGTILSTLLSTGESAFILDPKRELWRLSAGFRRSLGHECICFSPTSVEGSPRWNCLEEVEKGPGEMHDLQVIADNLITRPAEREAEDHWISSARNLFRLLCLHSLYAEKKPSIASVRRLLNSTTGSLDDLFERLAVYPHAGENDPGWRSVLTGERSRTHPEVRILAAVFREIPDRERGSIVSTLQNFLHLWGSDVVAANTAACDFSVRDFLKPEPISLYVSLPYGDVQPMAPLLRVLLALLTRHLTEDELAPGLSRRPIRFFLDEFAALGRIPIVESMLAFFRAYGVRAHIVVQDIGQLRSNYSAYESISANCQIHVAAATQSLMTRQHVSQLSGEATVRYEHRSTSSGGGGGALRRRATVSQVANRRPLLTEGEVGTLPADRLVILKTGMQPIFAWKYPYFANRELARRAAIPPPPAVRRKEG